VEQVINANIPQPGTREMTDHEIEITKAYLGLLVGEPWVFTQYQYVQVVWDGKAWPATRPSIENPVTTGIVFYGDGQSLPSYAVVGDLWVPR
jgi:hypothetical protein